ncbi:uncharacterized protein isoform X2 [Rhodnius prolixus]|uniref:uncharacterized protein isoform X2 n=1 Tax=Rhodnius prolixus TaxID=13249 RepID=UPI003D189AB8
MKIKKTRKVRQKRANVQVETFTKRSSEREQTKFKRKYSPVIVQHHDRPRWYKTRFKNPDRNKDPLALLHMFAEMFRLWLGQDILLSVTTKFLRRSISVLTVISMLLGVISLIIGVAHILKIPNLLDPNPYHPIARSHYIGISIMGTVMSISSILAFLGIYRKIITFTKVFALFSFIYGYLLSSIYISWITQIYFVKIHFYQKSQKNEIIVKGKRIIKEIVSEVHFKHEQDRILYNLTYFFMNLIVVAAFLQLSSGVLSLWLLVLHSQKQGYIPLYSR